MISVTILVKNGERHLQKVLEALQPFDEVVLYDTGSTDATLEIARTFSNITLVERPFEGFGPSHNAASALAKHDWILSVDSDEVLSGELVSEILALDLSKETVYALPRHNYYRGKQIKWCGWHPETTVRLYNRTKTAFSEALVHEGVITDNLQVITLKNPLRHYPYDSISDFLVKMERYSTLFAEQNRGKRRSSPLISIWHAIGAFVRTYFIKGGLFDGYPGFLVASYNAHTALYKYLKLYEVNRCS